MNTKFFIFLEQHKDVTVLSWSDTLSEITVEIEKRSLKDIEEVSKEMGYTRAKRNDHNTHTYPGSITFHKT